MLTIRNLFFSTVLSSLGLFVGCGGGDNPSSSGTGDDNSSAEALRIAYSDWPGWVAWEIGIQKGFFKDAGVNVEFTWLDYVPSMDSFAAGKVDAVCMTNGDALVTGATGKKGIAILINDFSNGNDMVVAKQGIDSAAALKGKKIGVEVGSKTIFSAIISIVTVLLSDISILPTIFTGVTSL